jgi:hypothetical protein
MCRNSILREAEGGQCPTAFDLNAGFNEMIERYVSGDQQAKDNVQAGWSGFAVADRRMCGGETTDHDSAIPPSYVGR